MRAVVGCGHHPKNPTIQALFELRCDPPEVLNLGEEDLAGEIKGPKRGLRNIYANKIPTLVDLELAPDLQAAVGLPMAEIVRLATLVSAVRSLSELTLENLYFKHLFTRNSGSDFLYHWAVWYGSLHPESSQICT
jgi:hypothetical protein